MEENTELEKNVNDLPEEDAADTAEDPALTPPKFVIETTLNAEMQLEASTALAPPFAKYINYICIGLSAVMTGILVWRYFNGGTNGDLIMAALPLIAIGYLLYTMFASPKKALRRWEDNMRKSFGSPEAQLVTEFYEHSLAQTIDKLDDVVVDGYSALRDMKETEHLFLLRSSRGQWFFLSKSGFKVGDEAAFRSFLSEKVQKK